MDEVGPQELEGELEVLLTQAACKRAEIERARGFSKPETSQAREARIKDVKSRMPCSACKANNDKDRNKEKTVLAVAGEELSDSDEDILELPTSSSYHATSHLDDLESSCKKGQVEEVHTSHVYSNGGEPDRNRLALSDTCCARTVAGKKWIQRHLRYLGARGEDVFVVHEARPFRFGGGPGVMSEFAVILPLVVRGASRIAWIRVSVVDQDVPLLLSKSALKGLGRVMDLQYSTSPSAN